MDEVDLRRKKTLGAGAYHRVYESKKHPDKIFKVGYLDTIQETYEYFKKYPYYFPKVFGMKKLGHMVDETGEDLYYLILEKLDTKRFMVFWTNLTFISEDLINMSLYDLVHDVMILENEWWELLEYLKIEKKNMFDQALELYELVYELNQILEYPDIHNNQFGYDKDGILKCLDF